MTHFIVMHRSAHMPNSCRGRYRRVGIVETDLPIGQEPKMLSTHARGVVKIVKTWERLNHTTGGPRTAFSRALVEAQEMVNKLNAPVSQ
jgi:hypothetical protein